MNRGVTSSKDVERSGNSGDFPVHINQSLWIKVEKLGVISDRMPNQLTPAYGSM